MFQCGFFCTLLFVLSISQGIVGEKNDTLLANASSLGRKKTWIDVWKFAFIMESEGEKEKCSLYIV